MSSRSNGVTKVELTSRRMLVGAVVAHVLEVAQLLGERVPLDLGFR